MGILKELHGNVKVIVGEEEYIHKNYIIERLEKEKADCANQDEKDEIVVAIRTIQNC